MKNDEPSVLVADSVGVPPLSAAPAKTQVKLLNVQVLRAYAAFTVVVFHTGFIWGPYKNLGRFGVDTFFVISGFMMAYICATNPENFLLRRVARIVPLYWLATCAVFALAWISPSLVKATSRSWAEFAKSLLFIPFYKSNGLIQPTLFVGWSINDEMFFYAVIVIALLFFRRHAAAASLIMVFAVFVALWLLQPHSAAAISYTRTDILGFLIGIICFWVYNAVHPGISFRFRFHILLVAVAAALAQILIAVYGSPSTRQEALGWALGTTPWFMTQFGILAAPGILVLCAVLLDRAEFSIKWSFLILLGDASYATYLVHIYCMTAFNSLAVHLSVLLRTTTVPGMLFAVIVAQGAGVLIYLYFDKPAHTWFRRKLELRSFPAQMSKRLEPAKVHSPR